MSNENTFSVTLHVNGAVVREDVPNDMLLIDFLHERLGLTGTKFSCGVGACGACKVAAQETARGPHMPLLACYARMASIDGLHITTSEGVGSETQLHPLQAAFLDDYSFQCGFSTPGFLMAGFVLLEQLKRAPIHESVLPSKLQESLGGHICRCTGYVRYFGSVEQTIRSTPGLLLEGEPPDVQKAEPRVSFRARKQSSNDLNEKYVVGYLGRPDGLVEFDEVVRLDTCRATLRFDFASLRTGESVRDMNVRRFLFGPVTHAQFAIQSVTPLESRFQLDTNRRGLAIPVSILGTLTIAKQTVPVNIDADVALLSGNQLRVTSHRHIELDMRDMGLEVAAFAAEFFLKLRPTVEIAVDMELEYRVV